MTHQDQQNHWSYFDEEARIKEMQIKTQQHGITKTNMDQVKP